MGTANVTIEVSQAVEDRNKLEKPKGYDHKQKLLFLFLCVLLLATVLRIFNIGHQLVWDEAWNVHASVDLARGTHSDIWFGNFYRHPPLYIGLSGAFAWVTGAGKYTLSSVMEMFSLLFSLGTVFLIFLCGKDWFDEKAGLIAAFLYAVMPTARIFDTWIKQDSMTVFFSILFLFLFFRKKYVVAGIALALAFLCKETAIFVLLPVPVSVLLFDRTRKGLTGLGVTVLIGFLGSFWWYVFYSISKGTFFNFFIGKGDEPEWWYQKWYYYLQRIPGDIGWPALLLLLSAVVLALFFLVKKRDENLKMVSFLLLWFTLTYIPLSMSYGKPPWMVVSAWPAVALLGGWAAWKLLSVIPGKRSAYAVVGVVLISALALSLTTSLNREMKKAYSSFADEFIERDAAQYINKNNGRRVMMSLGDASPTFLYYLDSYDPKKVLYILTASDPRINGAGDTLLLLESITDPSKVAQRILYTNPDFFLIRRKPLLSSENPDSTIATLEQFVRPEVFGTILLFDGHHLSSDINRAVGGQ